MDMPLRPLEYYVVWKEGALDAVLKPEHIMPVVTRMKPGGQYHSAGGNVGDVLMMVNNEYTIDLGFKITIKLLQNGLKPILLRFSRPRNPSSDSLATKNSWVKTTMSSMDSSETCTLLPCSSQQNKTKFLVQWSDGPLGVVLQQNREKKVHVVRKTSEKEENKQVRVGDRLISIAGIPLSDLGSKEYSELLKSVQKPVVLEFQTSLSEKPTTVSPRHRSYYSNFSESSDSSDEDGPLSSFSVQNPQVIQTFKSETLHVSDPNEFMTEKYPDSCIYPTSSEDFDILEMNEEETMHKPPMKRKSAMYRTFPGVPQMMNKKSKFKRMVEAFRRFR